MYTADIKSGFVIVAYPEGSDESEFGFDYWVTATKKPKLQPNMTYKDMMKYIENQMKVLVEEKTEFIREKNRFR